jgi:hypothetical protein
MATQIDDHDQNAPLGVAGYMRIQPANGSIEIGHIHYVYKRRNRDTAWYSVIDSEWPELEACFQAWLGPDNFDANGRRRQKLSALTQSLTTQTGGSE